MAKVIFTADWHFGAGNTWGKIDPATGQNSSLEATMQCLGEMLEWANANKVTGLVFAGDAFHRRNPTDIERLSFLSVFTNFLMADPSRWAVLIPGTPSHDGQDLHIPNLTSLSLYKRMAEFSGLQKRLFVATNPCVIERGDLELYLAVGLGEKTANKKGLDRLWERAKARSRQKRAIAVLHGVVQGATVSSGDFELPSPFLTTKDIHLDLFDLAISGHLHKHQVLHNGKVLYPGSVDRVDFGEHADQKGFICYRTKAAKWDFIPLTKAKRFITVDVNLNAGSPWKPSDKEAEEMKGAVVKLRFKGPKHRFKEFDMGRMIGFFAETQPMHLAIDVQRDPETGPVATAEVRDLDYRGLLEAYLKQREGMSEKLMQRALEEGGKLLVELRG